MENNLINQLNGLEVKRAEVAVFSYATENNKKVERAARNTIPDFLGGIVSDFKKVRGYFNDPITFITLKIKQKKQALQMLIHLVKSLDAIDQQKILDEAADRIDEAGNFYIRINKQKAINRKYELDDADSIRIIFRFRIPHKKNPKKILKKWIESIVENDEKFN